MSLADLAALLWRQRELLERLTYRLDCEQLLLSSGRTRWLNLATSDVETVLEELRIVEFRRSMLADGVAKELGLELGASLEELAAAANPPWTEVLLEHRDAMISLTYELKGLAESNQDLLEAGARAVEIALAGVQANGLIETPSAAAYDAQGRTESGRSGQLMAALRTRLDQDL